MSWYFLGGFSAYLSVPSGRRWNHSGCSVSHGWSGEHWIAKSMQTSQPTSRPRAVMRSKSAPARGSGLTASSPPSAEPIAHGLPGSPRPATSVLFFPFRFVLPIGWTGGRYTTSKPSPASCGSTLSTPLNPPHERGKSSYQEPNAARSRSTSTTYVSDHVFSWRSPDGAASASSTVSDSTPSNSAPSASSELMSACPASDLRRTSHWYDATRSTHASMRKHHRPHSSAS